MKLCNYINGHNISTYQLKNDFENASPFKNLSRDNFLCDDLANKLLSEFPKTSQGKIDENGNVSRKVFHSNIKELGPSMRQLDELFSSSDFLTYLSGITGIADLVFDPHYMGGGIHMNFNGQGLLPHVDFNKYRLNNEDLHRRLNIIIYFNKDWKPENCGQLFLFKKPTESPEISIAPNFNTMAMFETNEYSWHGFNQIENVGLDSRKSIAIYYYTRSRPNEETEHMTFYYPINPLTNTRTGNTIDLDQVSASYSHFNGQLAENSRLTKNIISKVSLGRRMSSNLSSDGKKILNQLYKLDVELTDFLYNREKKLSVINQSLESNKTLDLAQKICSENIKISQLKGVYSDWWVEPTATILFTIDSPVNEFIFHGYLSDNCHEGMELEITLNDKHSTHKISSGQFSIKITNQTTTEINHTLTLRSNFEENTADARNLSYILRHLNFQ
jgi:Rps23 Pro-64 3,4-dihydroxylase Tpa1-like proline 4-hydroxylase